ncbi:acyl carrier protein phosphodiesterase [Algoriphagus aquimarinus]|uniref:Acyl carrier protein phosphodiesterase n=1 Tax=Algoriphagus aquimarinus TaxID=237018 RepID=A0A1I1BQT8_9BACT|nr:ACP phosphodiesterase [Algoriphagus aquimarinus]SFB52661.1 Acyl carrier protein phosphodiesterase [Algoriphagus aquimarinus]
MNYLAHAYLSFGQDEVLVGNFMGDFVKGKMMNTFPEEVQNGIKLHRAIDKFTDTHPLVRAGQSYLRPQFGHYATVITDIYFDYYLSKNWEKYSRIPLEDFIQNTFTTLKHHRQLFPDRFANMFQWMVQDNWLLKYGEIKGMEQTFIGMSRRTSFDSKMEVAHLALLEKEAEFQVIFFAFFEDLETFAREKLLEIQEANAGH